MHTPDPPQQTRKQTPILPQAMPKTIPPDRFCLLPAAEDLTRSGLKDRFDEGLLRDKFAFFVVLQLGGHFGPRKKKKYPPPPMVPTNIPPRPSPARASSAETPPPYPSIFLKTGPPGHLQKK